MHLRHVRWVPIASALLLAAPAGAFSERSLELAPRAALAGELEFVAVAELFADAAAPVADPYAAHADLYADDEPLASDPWAADADLYSDDEAWDDEEAAFSDPFEGANRRLLAFNDGVDRFLLDPAAKAYDFVMPDPAERAVERAFTNLNSPAVFVNDLLQLELKRAGVTLSRFVLNSTVGVAGLFDVAGAVGLDGHRSDFGQTMARMGVGSGPYMVLPLLGPSTARDAVGFGVDLLFRPLFYLIGPIDFLIVGTGNGVVVRASYVEELQALREGSVDYYSALRNAYLQRRAEELRR